jgi:hypothetical protein
MDESGLVELVPEEGPFPEDARTERISMRANLCVCGLRVWSSDIAQHVAWHAAMGHTTPTEVDTPTPDPLDEGSSSGVSS